MRRLTSRRTPMRTPAMTATEVRGLSTRVRENGKYHGDMREMAERGMNPHLNPSKNEKMIASAETYLRNQGIISQIENITSQSRVRRSVTCAT